jgi:hypothetical protein
MTLRCSSLKLTEVRPTLGVAEVLLSAREPIAVAVCRRSVARWHPNTGVARELPLFVGKGDGDVTHTLHVEAVTYVSEHQ